MDSLDEMGKSSNGMHFFKHVFNFDEESKMEIMNIVQYAIIALIPVIILNKTMQHFVPEADDEKGNIELSAEIIGQIIFLFLGILIIHRIVTYIPTYSGEKYVDFSLTNIIIAFLVIMLSLQTKLGEKVSILYERVIELWEGPKKIQKQTKQTKQIKISQPISQPTQSYNTSNTTSINSLPTIQPEQSMQPQTQPDFNQMYQQNQTPLVDANSPQLEPMEPMAANSAGAFGSVFGNSNW